MKRAVRIFLLSGILLNTAALFAEETPAFEFERFNFYFENDIFDKTDKNYTSGLKFSAIYQVDTNAYRYLEMPFIHDKTKNHFLTLLIGQEIYTPEDTDSAIPNPEDQPYAGWLYAGFALQQANSREADTLELQLGVVGPAALGEQTQNFMHTVTASRSSNGWDYQLHNEPGIVLAYEHRWRYLTDTLFSGLDADAIPYAGFALGNVHTYLNSGAAVRIGWNIPHDFGNTVMHPAQETGLPAARKDAERYKPKWAFYFLSAFDLNVAERNIFLDGNTFKDSPSVPNREYLMAEFTAGFSINYGSLDLAFLNTYNTKNYPLNSRGYSYGSLVVSYVY